ncbi:hypothetical protein Tco_1573110, partial [Tanacetum coccineum]
EKELILLMVKAADLEISMHGDYYGMLIEPKKISKALEKESWVDDMQEELLQFEQQKV